jgi:hypothetical protein
LLQEVRVAVGAVEDQVESVWIKRGSCALRGDCQSGRGSRSRQAPDRAVVKETLRVGLGVLEHQRELWQTRCDEEDGGVLLADAMHRGRERCQASPPEELNLVEQERRTRTVLGCYDRSRAPAASCGHELATADGSA